MTLVAFCRCVRVYDIMTREDLGSNFSGSMSDVVYADPECPDHGDYHGPTANETNLGAHERDQLVLAEAYEQGWA